MDALKNAHAIIIGIANYQHIRKLPSNVLNDAKISMMS
jgi:hypothetical protein